MICGSHIERIWTCNLSAILCISCHYVRNFFKTKLCWVNSIEQSWRSCIIFALICPLIGCRVLLKTSSFCSIFGAISLNCIRNCMIRRRIKFNLQIFLHLRMRLLIQLHDLLDQFVTIDDVIGSVERRLVGLFGGIRIVAILDCGHVKTGQSRGHVGWTDAMTPHYRLRLLRLIWRRRRIIKQCQSGDRFCKRHIVDSFETRHALKKLSWEFFSFGPKFFQIDQFWYKFVVVSLIQS